MAALIVRCLGNHSMGVFLLFFDGLKGERVNVLGINITVLHWPCIVRCGVYLVTVCVVYVWGVVRGVHWLQLGGVCGVCLRCS